MLSKVTPRILILLERETGVPATLMMEMGEGVLAGCVVPSDMTSVLSGLRALFQPGQSSILTLFEQWLHKAVYRRRTAAD